MLSFIYGEDYGINISSNLPVDVAKCLGDGIWELRPGFNRVFFFYFDNGTYVLLHHYRKKTQKTPKREKDKAKSERADYINRKEKNRELE